MRIHKECIAPLCLQNDIENAYNVRKIKTDRVIIGTKYSIKAREYWMIYRLSGFLAVVWFGSSSTPSPSPSPIIVRCRCHKPSGRNGDLHENHRFLFTADVIDLERRRNFKKKGAKLPKLSTADWWALLNPSQEWSSAVGRASRTHETF